MEYDFTYVIEKEWKPGIETNKASDKSDNITL
jgi:hypothetical protein